MQQVYLVVLLCISVFVLTQQRSDERLGHLKAFGEQGPKYRVDEWDGFPTSNKFFAEYVNRSKPLLMKGAAKLSPAWDLWTDEYLSKNSPDDPSGYTFIEHGKKENRSQRYGYIPFKEFMAKYNDTEIYMVSDIPKFMLKDLMIPLPLQCKSLIKGGLDTHVMWFSSGGTSSVVHHDSFENINCLYRGSKHLVFIETNKYMDMEPKLIDKESGSYSSIDVDKVDLDSRPYLAGVEYGHVDMEPGDCLYIPFKWIHQVRSFGSNLAANVWWEKNIKVEGCLQKEKKSLTFADASFKTLITQALSNIRAISKTLNEEDIRTAEELTNALSNKNTDLEKEETFKSAVMDVFKALDKNSDGVISVKDTKQKETYKFVHRAEKALDDYNRLVHKYYEGQLKTEGPKPLYIFRDNPDIFSEENSLGFPAGPPAAGEDSEDGNEAGNEKEAAKDEL